MHTRLSDSDEGQAINEYCHFLQIFTKYKCSLKFKTILPFSLNTKTLKSKQEEEL